jgi:hypothetical protein
MDANPVDEKEQQLRDALAECEKVNGPEALPVAAVLLQLAEHLRANKKVLEAVNLEARARNIRKKAGIPDLESGGDDSYAAWHNEQKQQRKTTTILIGVLFVLSIICRLMSNIVPVFAQHLGYIFSGIAFICLTRAGHPLDTWVVRGGVMVVWVIILFCLPGIRGAFSPNSGMELPTSQTVRSADPLGDHQYQEAFDQFDKSAKQHPDQVDPLIGRARAAAGLGRDQDAINDCNQALKMMSRVPAGDPQRVHEPDLYMVRGLSYLKLGKYDHTVEDMNTVSSVDTNPNRRGLPLYAAYLARKKGGNEQEAQQYREKASKEGIDYDLEPEEIADNFRFIGQERPPEGE